MVLAAVLSACGEPDAQPPPTSVPPPTTATAPPTVAEPVVIDPLVVGEPCAVVDRALRRELRVDVEGYSYSDDGTRICRWEVNGQKGIGLGVSVESNKDPLRDVFDRAGARASEVRGFPAVVFAVEAEHVCDIYVKTAPSQGFSVIYGALDQRIDACGGAMRVADHLAGKVRRG